MSTKVWDVRLCDSQHCNRQVGTLQVTATQRLEKSIETKNCIRRGAQCCLRQEFQSASTTTVCMKVLPRWRFLRDGLGQGAWQTRWTTSTMARQATTDDDVGDSNHENGRHTADFTYDTVGGSKTATIKAVTTTTATSQPPPPPPPPVASFANNSSSKRATPP